jgi:hypothetical protein
MNRARWLTAILLSLPLLSSVHAQGTGPTVPDTPPTPLDSEQRTPDREHSSEANSPPIDRHTQQREDPRPRSERLPKEIAPSSESSTPPKAKP